MISIKELCTIVNQNLLNSLQNYPEDAVYTLANLYSARKRKGASNSDRIKIDATLASLKQRITPTQIKKLWDTLKVIGIKQSLSALKYELISYPQLIQQIHKKELVNIGRYIQAYPYVFLALIRKYAQEKGKKDPLEAKWNPQLLLKENREQNVAYISSFVKSCRVFPKRSIISLGEHKIAIAKLILSDTKDSRWYTEIGAAFAHRYPSLRKKIANDWKKNASTLQYTQSEQIKIKNLLAELKEKYVEFKDIKLKMRVPHNAKFPKQKESNWPFEIDNTFCALSGAVAGQLASKSSLAIPIVSKALTFAYATVQTLTPAMIAPMIAPCAGAVGAVVLYNKLKN